MQCFVRDMREERQKNRKQYQKENIEQLQKSNEIKN